MLVLGEECRRINEYIKKQREEGFNCLLTYAQMCDMHLPDEFVLEARIKFLRACLDLDFPSLPLWRPGFVGKWEAAGADDAVNMFEGTGPGCSGAAVQVGTSGAPTTWTECEMALAKNCEGTSTLEPEPAWKEEYDGRGLDPHEIK
eukprot:jgi/Tetstr1/428928/TSEL_018904.t1